MRFSRIIEGMRDAVAGRVERVTVIHTSRQMTDAEAASFNKAFDQMDVAMDEMGKAMDALFKHGN